MALHDLSDPVVERGFLRVGAREVHYRVVGAGPPALFIHSSPTNGSFVLPDMLAQAGAYRCFAFDTPGFGLSDPLPLAEMKVADLADAIAAAITVLGLPPLPVFGTHSGAAIALELGYRHPSLVTGLVLDAVPIFTPEEVTPLHAGGYFAPLVVDRLGGHYAATWTRFHDQSVWFPWCDPRPENINEYDLAAPEVTHRWLEMFFAAALHYRPAYSAISSYGADAITAAAGLNVPAVFTAADADMLRPHLQRLPKLRADQEVVWIGNDHARKRALTGRAFARFGSPGEAPTIAAMFEGGTNIRRDFVMDGTRAQFVRVVGDRTAPPLLLLHDVPGSGALLCGGMAELAAHFVICPDLPGSGESSALPPGSDLAKHAQALWRLCDAIGVETLTIHGLGLSASLALEMAILQPARVVSLKIDGLYLPDIFERAAMIEYFAPPIVIERDGAHWYRTFMMLRDSLIYWPWFDTRRAALRRVNESFEGDRLHLWTVEVMKQREGYGVLIDAILRQDAAAMLRKVLHAPILLAPVTPVGHAHRDRLTALLR